MQYVIRRIVLETVSINPCVRIFAHFPYLGSQATLSTRPTRHAKMFALETADGESNSLFSCDAGVSVPQGTMM